MKYNLHKLEINERIEVLILDCRKIKEHSEDDIVTDCPIVGRFSPDSSLINIFIQIQQAGFDKLILIVRNPGVQLDSNFRHRLHKLTNKFNEIDLNWALIGPTGIELDGNVHSCIYPSATPRLFNSRNIRPIIDSSIDIFIINGSYLSNLDFSDFLEITDSSLPQAIILQGYLDGRISLYSPDLACGILGSELGRDHVGHEIQLRSFLNGRVVGTVLPTLSGSMKLTTLPPTSSRVASRELRALIDLADKIRATTAVHCNRFSLTIVTRTQFKRLHLLHRLLASVVRARCADIDLEVLLATDVPADSAEFALDGLRARFPELDIRLTYGDPAKGPSRVSNLVAGIEAARYRYVCIVDDDDYVAASAFAALSTICFIDDEPLVIMASDVVRETWERTPLGRYVITSHQQTATYWPDKWRSMFHGVNQLPICALVAPSDWIRSRVAQFNFKHDLSEDYTLYLLLFTAPDLPRIHELADVFCNISIRDDASNTVTMDDRRPWVRDISNHLATLLLEEGPVASGTVQVLAGTQGVPDRPGAAGELEAVRADNMRLRDMVLGLRREVRALREQLSNPDVAPG